MQVKLLLFTFYLNGRFNAVSIAKPSEWMSNFWTVPFLKTESEPNFGFPHIPSSDTVPLHIPSSDTVPLHIPSSDTVPLHIPSSDTVPLHASWICVGCSM